MAIGFHPLSLLLPSIYRYLFVVTGPGGVSPGPELLGGDELQLHVGLLPMHWLGFGSTLVGGRLGLGHLASV